MIRQLLFDRALFVKRIGSIGTMVAIEVGYIIFGVFFGLIEMQYLFTVISVIHVLLTCMLFQTFTLSKGELILELNTEKSVYFPTTRINYLKSKYVITLVFLSFQLMMTFLCLGLGYLGSRGQMGMEYVIGSLLTVGMNILLTSGIIILVMHMNPMAMYLPFILMIPLGLVTNVIASLLKQQLYPAILLIGVAIAIAWIAMLYLGKIIYEKV